MGWVVFLIYSDFYFSSQRHKLRYEAFLHYYNFYSILEFLHNPIINQITEVSLGFLNYKAAAFPQTVQFGFFSTALYFKNAFEYIRRQGIYMVKHRKFVIKGFHKQVMCHQSMGYTAERIGKALHKNPTTIRRWQHNPVYERAFELCCERADTESESRFGLLNAIVFDKFECILKI